MSINLHKVGLESIMLSLMTGGEPSKSVRMGVPVLVPEVPDALEVACLEGRTRVSIAYIPEEGLTKIGEEWTANLLARAAALRAKEQAEKEKPKERSS